MNLASVFLHLNFRPSVSVIVWQVVIGPNMSLPEGTVVSMHHPEEEEEDDDEFLSDDAEVGPNKDKAKQKGVC